MCISVRVCVCVRAHVAFSLVLACPKHLASFESEKEVQNHPMRANLEQKRQKNAFQKGFFVEKTKYYLTEET